MTTISSEKPVPPVNPRLGIAKGLGIANIVFAVLGVFSTLSTVLWLAFSLMVKKDPPQAEAKVEVVVTASASASAPTAPAAGKRSVLPFFNPFIGMDDVNILRYSYAAVSTEILLVALMFATGIGLLNLKSWAGRWWYWLSWASILRAFLLGGYWILVVTPTFSEIAARSIAAAFQQSGMAARAPSVQELMRIYSIMFLIVGIGIIVLYSIYPIISILLLGRPGVKAALAETEKPPSTEFKLP